MRACASVSKVHCGSSHHGVCRERLNLLLEPPENVSVASSATFGAFPSLKKYRDGSRKKKVRDIYKDFSCLNKQLRPPRDLSKSYCPLSDEVSL